VSILWSFEDYADKSSVNTDRFVHSTFPTCGQIPYEDGDLSLDGVSGKGAALRLDFMDPAGSMTGQLLPTGSAVDVVQLPDGRAISVSCIDAANPFVFVPLDQVGLDHTVTLAELSHPQLVADLMMIRALASIKMGLATNLVDAARCMGTPKLALVGPSPDLENDIVIRAFSMGKPHPTIQMTGAVCVGAASAVPGSVVNAIVQGKEAVVIGHAGGSMVVTGKADCSGPMPEIISGSVYRTARRLMEGSIIL
jgi:2-methylaconitate cis-trans-isomerase PrpF